MREWGNAVERLCVRVTEWQSLTGGGHSMATEPEGARRIRIWGIGGDQARGLWHPQMALQLEDGRSCKNGFSPVNMERSELITDISAVKFLELQLILVFALLDLSFMQVCERDICGVESCSSISICNS